MIKPKYSNKNSVKQTFYSGSNRLNRCHKFSKKKATQKTSLVAFLQGHYLDSEAFLYDISERTVDTWLSGQKYQSFVSFYYEEKTEEEKERRKQHPQEWKHEHLADRADQAPGISGPR